MDKIRNIHVGLGRWGTNWAAHVLEDHPDIETVAYVELDAAKRAAMATRLGLPESMFFADLGEALAKIPSETVTIAVPVAAHAPTAQQALEAGRHVVVEKPFTATLAEAKALVALAAARGLTLAVSQNYRYYPAAQMVADLAHRGYFGRIIGGKIDFRRNGIMERAGNIDWPHPMLADMAVHHYDLMRMVIGEDPIEVTARSWNPLGSPYREDAAAAMVLTFPGATISYRGSWMDPSPQTAWAGDWQLDCERASILWTGRGDQPWQTKRDRVQIRRPNNPELEDVALPDYPLHDRAGVLAALAEAIRSGKEPAFFPSGRANLGTLMMIEAAIKSAANGGAPVRLDSIA